jgi:predicted AAA+ superfamily ATPase
LTESFVAQELTARLSAPLHYWTSEGRAEVDFLVEEDGRVYPLEVKAGLATKSKSLRVYADRHAPPVSSRASLRNLRRTAGMCNYPLYLVCRFPSLCLR